MSYLKDLLTASRTIRAERIERVEKRDIAKRFNDRYTYRKYWRDSKNAWMCEECNMIHRPMDVTIWTGLQYPGCCSTPAGHRLYKDIAYEK